jgi:hypothetical protein
MNTPYELEEGIRLALIHMDGQGLSFTQRTPAAVKDVLRRLINHDGRYFRIKKDGEFYGYNDIFFSEDGANSRLEYLVEGDDSAGETHIYEIVEVTK